IRDAWRRAPDRRARLRALFGPPETLGVIPAASPPPRPSRDVTFYAAGHLALAAAATLGIVLPGGLPWTVRLGVAGLVLVTLGVLGGLLDGRTWARPSEGARLAVLLLAGALLR